MIFSKKPYTITFYDNPHWVSLSNIDKKTFYGFIDYLYSLDRNIIVLPYISGGLEGPCKPVNDKDRTDKVLSIVKDIKDKVPVHKMLTHYFSENNIISKRFSKIHFNEDIFEFLLSLKINRGEAIKIAYRCQYGPDIKELQYLLLDRKHHNTLKIKAFLNWLKTGPNILRSRWMFIYMFRNEFKKYMNDRGYKVFVVDGWVLNNKKREYQLGLIDENGELY